MIKFKLNAVETTRDSERKLVSVVDANINTVKPEIKVYHRDQTQLILS